MISREPRVIYRRNPLADVICQLRFPQILSIETELPVAFQEAIRGAYPRFSQRKEGLPGKQTVNYQFVSEDGSAKVNLGSGFISLSCNRYTRWEDFARRLDQPLAAFISIYHPAYFERVGLRYVNIISRKKLELEEVPFRELIMSSYLGILSHEEVLERSTLRCTVDADTALAGGCRVKLHAGPGALRGPLSPDPEVKFILDLDFYMNGKVEPKFSAGALETLHSQSFGVFRGAITDTLHQALEPMD